MISTTEFIAGVTGDFPIGSCGLSLYFYFLLEIYEIVGNSFVIFMS